MLQLNDRRRTWSRPLSHIKGLVLVVDGHASEREELTETIRDAKYVVISAASVGAAKQVVGLYRFAFVISEVDLADAPGGDLLQAFRRVSPRLPFFLIGRSFESIDESAATKVTGFFRKPISPVRIVSEITSLLQ